MWGPLPIHVKTWAVIYFEAKIYFINKWKGHPHVLTVPFSYTYGETFNLNHRIINQHVAVQTRAAISK